MLIDNITVPELQLDNSQSHNTKKYQFIAVIVLSVLVFCLCWSNYEKAQRQLELDKADAYQERQSIARIRLENRNKLQIEVTSN